MAAFHLEDEPSKTHTPFEKLLYPRREGSNLSIWFKSQRKLAMTSTTVEDLNKLFMKHAANDCHLSILLLLVVE
jgi:hypothetical protein